MFVVPCRFDPERPVVFECIENIQAHHADPDILVVDSDSPDKSYLDWCRERGCIVADIANHGYATGAWSYAVRNHPDDFYYLMFDSVSVQSNLEHLETSPLTTLRHWHSTQHGWGWHEGSPDRPLLSVWGGEQLDRMGVPRTEDYHGAMGPVMFIQRRVVDDLESVGYWDTQVRDVWEHAAMERVAGIVLGHLGYDVTNSLQGTHTHHQAAYDERFVKKYDLCRP